MQRVDLLLSNYISSGEITWETLEKKLTAYLDTVGHTAEATDENGKKIKIADAVTFKVKVKDNPDVCVKLFKVRFHMGKIYAGGIQKGFYDNSGKPLFPFAGVIV